MTRHKVHLDTDLGGDLDDLCALAMLLCWPEVELTGITVVGDENGRRTGYTRYTLEVEGRNELPGAEGAELSGGYYRYYLGLPIEERYWPELVPPFPGPVERAIELLKNSIEQGAMIIGIGPYTNLYLLDLAYPGILMRAKLVLMGGFVYPVRPGYPAWGNNDDFNIQVDIRSAYHVLTHSTPTLVPLTVTVETALRRCHLDELRRAGDLGKLLARQAESFAEDEQIGLRFLPTCPGLPEDIINFQHDPLACAIALGWDDGVEIEDVPLVIEQQDGWLIERIDPTGKPLRVVTKIDGPRFSAFWLQRILGG
jgi:purine nucleosidase